MASHFSQETPTWPISSPRSTPVDSSYQLLNPKLEKLISLVQRQMEETESMKGEIASLRAEVSQLRDEKQQGDTKNAKRNSAKLPTDLSVSTNYSVHSV